MLLAAIIRPKCELGKVSMAVYVALLRAVNVGGTGILPMKELQSLCVELGLENVRTYIQSGNVLFDSRHTEPALTRKLQQAIAEKMGRPVGVLLRTALELRTIIDANPFQDAKPSQVGVVFLPKPAPADVLTGLAIPGREAVRMIGREVFIHYPDGMGRSKLKLPFAADGTTRNLNTVAKLLAMAEA
jgi:uncharacterized protein (DUF1697 family)